MNFEALKRLEASKDTVKKIDKYIQTLNSESNDYYKALCYKASVLHSLKNDDEALKIILPLERNFWMLQNDDVIVLCDILKDIYFDLNDASNALKYIKIKEDHLLLIDHDKYTKDMIAYYRFIGDIESEKRQILIYLEENIDEKELVGIYERLIEFSYNENNKNDFDKYYEKKLNEKVLKDTIGMNDPYYYRNKVKLPVRYDGEELVTGLYMADSNRLVYIDNCIIEKKDLREAVDEVCKYLTKYQVIAYNPKIHDGVLRHIVARSSYLTKEIQLTLILYKRDQRTINIAKDLLKINHIVSVYISVNDDLDSVENFGKETFLVAGKETITEKLGDYEFNLLPTAFFQLNLEQTEKLYTEIARVSKLKGFENVVDGYCGVGTIGLWLSQNAKEVRGIDNNKEAITNANQNAKNNQVSNAHFYSGSILTYLEKWEKEGFVPDVLVVDPPRTGMELKLINYLQEHPVKKIIYVSCNPSTLAKNCNHLQKKYHILSIQPLDMFPQTANVECIVCLERR